MAGIDDGRGAWEKVVGGRGAGTPTTPRPQPTRKGIRHLPQASRARARDAFLRSWSEATAGPACGARGDPGPRSHGGRPAYWLAVLEEDGAVVGTGSPASRPRPPPGREGRGGNRRAPTPPSPRRARGRTRPSSPSTSCTRPCAGRRGVCPRASRARSAATQGPARPGWGAAGLERSVCTSRDLSGALARRVVGLGRRGIKLGRRGPREDPPAVPGVALAGRTA